MYALNKYNTHDSRTKNFKKLGLKDQDTIETIATNNNDVNRKFAAFFF